MKTQICAVRKDLATDMSDSFLDKQLKEFLDGVNREKAKGYTNANIILKVEQCYAQVAEQNTRIDHVEHRLDRHGREIKQIKQRIEYDGEPNTGEHSIAHIQREVDRQRIEHDLEKKAKQEEVVWWKRQITMWIVAAVGFVAIQVISVVVSVLLAGKK